MSSWEGFVGRLRAHARKVIDPTTRGYLNTAADRIERLEDKLADTEATARSERLRANMMETRVRGYESR